MQATGDLGLVTLLASTGESSIPSKMHGYTAAGRPVIASVAEDSPTAVLVRENSVGWVVPPEDPEALAAAIRRADQDRDECLARGHRAREFFLREFGRSAQTKQFEEYLLALCAKER
jgi:glycosyltransferase involved in cell wall biosynthesis